MALPKRIGIDWPLTSLTGWGVVGLHLAVALCRGTWPRPVLFRKPQKVEIDPLRQHVLQPYLSAATTFADRHAPGPRPIVKAEFPVLHALSSGLTRHPRSPAEGKPDIGLAVIEDTRIGAEARAEAAVHARILAASTWVAGVLSGAGIRNVHTLTQGIDPSLFHPGPQFRPFGDRFVVFSGGKIEYRKAQDLVVEGFRRFHARHPEAFLLTCWQNPWPATAATIVAGGIARDAPRARAEMGIDVTGWFETMGLPPGSCLDVDFNHNGAMPTILREADVALFANRCEGGTNLLAMECLAAGVPTILSANTGHLDLLAGPDVALPLRRQVPVRSQLSIGTEGWGESDVEEIADALETVHRDRAGAVARAQRAAAWMASEWSWDRHVERLMAHVDAVA